ncbi:MAG: AAA family ATPase [Bacteroidetes bacterium CG02_land_8_20_14_3_00_31_25]|nr:ATP-binding protein [Bacteroidota bacterium]PIV58642.1 MAG: AAA family ATPase [Bacteroidetes bacterium CG02_land_8_20_14_3_00_31_25]PIX32836.1 MAG: AAA family ATPase [Bacteroidetes bacterium CG_4_8_14_3_um_filter_31_14]PIY04064.1 MAG: AAA family ATPase [Bacteroidetes bacterium CG_4_10_14_3_um_filter_31_20]
MAFERHEIQVLGKRLKEQRRFIQVLMGPRQVGKTTLITQLLKKVKNPYYFVSADGATASKWIWIEQQWEIARIKFKKSGAKDFIFVIDEIQKVENWSETVKLLWDEDSRNNVQIKVILLGSSRLLLQKGLTESLAGRFETTYLGHWSFIEMHNAFGWDENKFAWFGGYPGSAELIKDEKRWKHYISQSLIETSISKDILMLTRVDKPALMKRLFELGCLYSGQILSLTKILGQLQDSGNTITLSHYLNLLDTAGLLAGVEKYSVNKIKQRSSSPKFLVHNTALISSQKVETFKQTLNKPDQWGRIVESAIGAHLKNYSLTENYNLYYWRHRNDEIDFVLTKGNNVIGLEVKSGNTQKLSGMIAFKKQFNPNKTFLIGTHGITWQDLLKMNPAELF